MVFVLTVGFTVAIDRLGWLGHLLAQRVWRSLILYVHGYFITFAVFYFLPWGSWWKFFFFFWALNEAYSLWLSEISLPVLVLQNVYVKSMHLAVVCPHTGVCTLFRIILPRSFEKSSVKYMLMLLPTLNPIICADPCLILIFLFVCFLSFLHIESRWKIYSKWSHGRYCEYIWHSDWQTATYVRR